MNVFGIIAIEEYDSQGERFLVDGIDASLLTGAAITKKLDSEDVVGVVQSVKKIRSHNDVADAIDSLLWEAARHTPIVTVKATVLDETLKNVLAAGGSVYFAACGKLLERAVDSKEFDQKFRATLTKCRLDSVAITLRPAHRAYKIRPIGEGEVVATAKHHFTVGDGADPVAWEKPPMQPIVWAKDGCIRFQRNRVVDDLYEMAARAGFSLNQIVERMHAGVYTRDEVQQLDQLVGYSVSGFGDLSYVDRDVVNKADAIAYGMSRQKKGK